MGGGEPERAWLSFPIYLDEDTMRDRLVAGLRSEGQDVVTTFEAGNSGSDDLEQLLFASGGGRAILTANGRDYARLHDGWMAEGRSHAGIIVLSHQRITTGLLLTKLLRLLATRDSREMQDAILYMNLDPDQWLG